MNNSKNSKLLLRSVYISLIVLAIGLLIYLNFQRLYAVYIYTFKTEGFERGDKVYASNASIGSKNKETAIAALRMIRPMTEEEVKDIIMMSPDQRMLFLKVARNPNSKPYLTYLMSYFDTKEILKSKVTVLGEYQAALITRLKPLNQDKLYYATFYALKPNKKIYRFEFSNTELPDGYTLADSLVYVDPFFASNKITSIK
ncbi:hypothetical protein GWR56_11175 [Mucilaginibacter sp. 14171R-50]|uniref:hypothetical protein n=1 Tax=Mucilaginibacter sp. 14171R-50 TaxID=2703789 RepID=UPI00138C16FD|nr:hypothetical protein [Mucilaginibacter sp. 14171R-50]QHS56067.1 hypothetical protein GWR56_11175 [Mucilaginibacter sp. 14171R-50]